MVLLPWWPWWGEGAVVYGGALLAWTLALYVATRGGWQRIPVLATGTSLVMLVYLLGQALGDLSGDAATWSLWLRRTWWAAALAPAGWLLLVWALLLEEGPAWISRRAAGMFWPAAAVALTLGVALSVIGSSTELVERWSDPYPAQQALALQPGAIWHLPTGPLYGLNVVYTLACLLSGLACAGLLWRSAPAGSPLRSSFALLLLTAVLALLGGGFVVAFGGLLAVSTLPAEVLFVLGLGLMSWSVARYGALVAGESLTADFLSFATSLALVVVGYGLALLLLTPWELRWAMLLLLLGLMTTHVAAARRHGLAERLFLGRTPGQLQLGLLALADRVARQPDAVSAVVDVREGAADLVAATLPAVASDGLPAVPPLPDAAEFRVLVEGALRRLANLPALSRHPLADALPGPGAASASPLERANALRAELEAGIERLRPSGPRPTPGVNGPGSWLHYVVLHEAYVEGRPNKQVMSRWYLSEGSFNRARRGAIDALAEDLRARLLAPADEPALTTTGASA